MTGHRPSITTLAPAVNTFALTLYRVLAPPGGNIILSPLSAWSALAMTYMGTQGPAATEMARVLGLPSHDAMEDGWGRSVTARFASRALGSEVALAHAIWAQSGYDFRADFRSTIIREFEGELGYVDFRGQLQRASDTINRWVSEKTRHHIDRVLSGGRMPPETRVVVANAAYFKGAWRDRFDVGATTPQ